MSDQAPTLDPNCPITVEIVYAKAEQQVLLGLKLPAGATVDDAVRSSGLLNLFPEIDLTVNMVGIWGSVCRLDRRLEDSDRIEIYRPLRHDPKDARRMRAAKTP